MASVSVRAAARSAALLSLLASAAALRASSPLPRSVGRSAAASVSMKFGDDAHCRVCFVRHGQSQWNEANLFTGWADPALTTLGKNEAAEGATHMWKEGLHFDVAFTSELKRAQQTLAIIQTILGEEAVPVHKSWRLNERMQGLDKKETVEKYGADQVKEWRRSYSTPPPPVDVDSEYWPGNMNSYAHVPAADIPLSECLKDTVERTLPYWDAAVVPALTRGKTVLIAAREAASGHGNSIRGMLKMLDGIEDDDIVGLEIPTGVPLLYHLDKDLKPMKDPRSFGFLSGAFLGDPAEILAAQQKVAAQTQISSKETETEARARLFAEAQGEG